LEENNFVIERKDKSQKAKVEMIKDITNLEKNKLLSE